MLKKGIVLFVCLSLVLVAGTVLAQEFRAQLSANKVGPKPADTEGKGEAVFRLTENGKGLEYKLTVEQIEDVHMVHIHLGPEDATGLIVAWLYPQESARPKKVEGKINGVLAEGVIHAKDLQGVLAGKSIEDLVGAFRKGEAYVNVHSSKYVAGELRGQIK